jgi:HEAT repeat protein
MKILLVLCLFAAAGDAEKILADLSSSDYQTRRKAVLACEGRKEPEVLERLLVLAREDDHPNIRAAAVHVLPGFTDPRIFPLLVETARSSSNFVGPKQAALVALGKTKDERALPILLGFLSADSQSAAYAAKGLGHLGDERAFEPLLKLFLARPTDGWVGPAAPRALARIDPARTARAMLSCFGDLPSPAPRYAAEVLAKHGDESAVKPLLAFLSSPEKGRREAAIHALGGIGGETAVAALLAHLGKDSGDTAAVARAIRDCGDASAAMPVARALAREENTVTKLLLMEALAALGNRRAVGTIAAHLSDDTFVPQPPWVSAIYGFPYNTRVRYAAWWAIRRILDGKPPVPLAELSGFPEGPSAAKQFEKGVAKLVDWWRKHSKDEALHFPHDEKAD